MFKGALTGDALTAARLDAAATAAALGGQRGTLVDVSVTPARPQSQRNVLGIDYGYGQELLATEMSVEASVTVRLMPVR